MLPENNQQADYDYYAIDIANRPQLIEFVANLRGLIEKHNIDKIPSCLPVITRSVPLAEFPPCNPITFKLRQICEESCRTYTNIISQCFSLAIQTNIMISEFALLYDSYDCSDPNTYLPNVTDILFDSRQNCYNVSFEMMGMYVDL